MEKTLEQEARFRNRIEKLKTYLKICGAGLLISLVIFVLYMLDHYRWGGCK